MKKTYVVYAVALLVVISACSRDNPAVPPVTKYDPEKHSFTGRRQPAAVEETKKQKAAPPPPPPVVDLPDVPGRHDAVVIFPDGKSIVACGEDGVVQVYSIESKQLLVKFEGLPGEPRLALSNDGKLIAQGSRTDSPVKVWNVAEKREVRTMAGDNYPVSDLTFSRDGSQLAIASLSNDFLGSIQIWKLSENASPTVLKINGVARMDYSPDGTRLAAASTIVSGENGATSTVSIWDIKSGAATITIQNAVGPTYRVAFSPDGSTLAIAERNGSRAFQSCDRIRLVDSRNGQEQATLLGHAGEINGLTFTPDGQFLLSSGQDSMLRVWQLPTKSLRAIQDLRGCGYDRISFTNDGRHFAIAAGNGDRQVHPTVWDFEQALQFRPRYRGDVAVAERVMTERSGRQITALAFSNDGQRLATSNRSGQTQIYDSRTGIRQFETEMRALAFTPNLEKAVVDVDRIHLQELTTTRNETLPVNGTPRVRTPSFFAFTMSPDGQLLATTNREYGNGGVWLGSVLTVRNSETSELVAVATHPEELAKCCAISANSSRLVAGSEAKFSTQRLHCDGPVSVFELKNLAKAKDWKPRLLKRQVERNVSTAEKEAFAQAAKILESKGANGGDAELQAVLKGVIAELDEIKTSADRLDYHWQLLKLNQFGSKFDAVKFRVPEGEPLDFTWMTSLSRWIVDCDVIPIGDGKPDFRKRNVQFWEEQQGRDFRYTVMRAFCGPAVAPGREFIVWFALADQREQDGAIAVSFLRRGFLETEGWGFARRNDEEGVEPVMRRSHLVFHGDSVVNVAISPDGALVASVGANGTVKVWNVDAEQVVATCTGLMAEFSPDGKVLATANVQDGNPLIVLRDPSSGREIHTLRGGHFLGISTLAFSPDGKWLASGGFDGIVMVWNTNTGKPQ